MKNIIIPVDFSPHSENAIRAGATLARKFNAKLHVLHMLELSDSLISSSNSQRNNEMMFLLQLANKKFTPFLDKKYLDDIEIETMVKHHKVYSEVDELSNKVNADLIIMGSRGMSKDLDLFTTGSNASKMMRNSNTPVLIVKDGQEFSFNHAVIATDLTTESIKATERARSFFNLLGCDYRTVYINRPNSSFLSDDDFIERAEEFTHAGGSEEVINVNDYSIEAGLLSFSKRNNIDFIAVSTHARKGANYFFNGSISESVAHHSDLPVLSFRL